MVLRPGVDDVADKTVDQIGEGELLDPAPASGIITDRVSFFLPLAAERSTTTQAWSPFRMATTGSSNLEMFFKGRRTTRPTNPARAAARTNRLGVMWPSAKGSPARSTAAE